MIETEIKKISEKHVKRLCAGRQRGNQGGESESFLLRLAWSIISEVWTF